MVSNIRGRTYEERLAELGMVTLETRRQQGDMIQTFKIMSGTDQVKPETWFNLGSAVEREGAAQTRGVTGHLNIQERWASSEVRRNFFSLPVDNFKNGFDEWMSTSRVSLRWSTHHRYSPRISSVHYPTTLVIFHYVTCDTANNPTIKYSINYAME